MTLREALRKTAAAILIGGIAAFIADGAFITYLVAASPRTPNHITGQTIPLPIPSDMAIMRGDFFVTPLQKRIFEILFLVACPAFAIVGVLVVRATAIGVRKNPPTILWRDYRGQHTLTSQKAALIGSLWVKLPSVMLLVSTLIAALFIELKLIQQLEKQYSDPTVGAVIFIAAVGVLLLALSISLSWIWWSRTLNIWLRWAVARVADLSELKNEAITRELLSERDWKNRISKVSPPSDQS